MNRELTRASDWQNIWAKDRRLVNLHDFLRIGYLFDPVLSRFLPHDRDFRAIELGCYPGSYMAYLHKRYGYHVYGLDFIEDLHQVQENLATVGVPVEGLIEANLMTVQLEQRFDVVASFGLVEHFADVGEVIGRHCDLVAPGGYLVLTLPNFRGAQYWFHRWFDKTSLDGHNLDAMYPARLRRWVELQRLVVLACDYFQTFGFWVIEEPTKSHQRIALRIFARLAGWSEKALLMTHTDGIPNRYLSPYIVLVARRAA